MRLYTKADFERGGADTARKGSLAYRSPARRDYARLIHSPSFRRLQGKTQLFPGNESDFFRNRLTHSLEVAQVAKTIALRINEEKPPGLGEIDCDLIEFAALCHDLGHPPFGHNGEHALDDCMRQFGGFEGNAQTLRIVSRLEKKSYQTDDSRNPPDVGASYCGIDADGTDRRLGLNLTYRSLAAVLKYDRPIPIERKAGAGLVKGYYKSEEGLVKTIKRHVAPKYRGNKFKTIECAIMDIADDIAYSTYDLEDALKGGLVTPLSLLAKIATDESLLKRVTIKVVRAVPGVSASDVVRAVVDLFERIAPQPLAKKGAADHPLFSPIMTFMSSQNVSTDGYLRGGLTSDLVNNAIEGIEITVNREFPMLSTVDLRRETKIEVESLKHLTYEVVIQSPQLKVVEHRGYDVVERVFRALAGEDGHHLLPNDFRHQWDCLQQADQAAKMRLVCDFVAGMTDRYALEFYERLFGGGQSFFKPI